MLSCHEKVEESITQRTEIAKKFSSVQVKVDELKYELQEKNTRVPSYIEDSASLYLKRDYSDKEERKITKDEEERPKIAQKDESPMNNQFRIALRNTQKDYSPSNEPASHKEQQVQANGLPTNQGLGSSA
jgi:hypothetical protein